MALWQFTIQEEMVKYGNTTRRKLTRKGCNEPFKDRYWCPKAQWFKRERCPFENINECENFVQMCGCV